MSTEKRKTAGKGEIFKEAGWIIPEGLLPENFYFSKGAYYDFIQILSNYF